MITCNDQLSIDQNSEYLQEYFKFKVSEDNKVLPSIYLISKLRKNPTETRFIIASPISSLKPQTKLITSVFKVIYRIALNNSNKCHYFSRVDTY